MEILLLVFLSYALRTSLAKPCVSSQFAAQSIVLLHVFCISILLIYNPIVFHGLIKAE